MGLFKLLKLCGMVVEHYTKYPELQNKQSNQMKSSGDSTKGTTNGRGGWISSLLLLGTSFGLNIAAGAWTSNLIVFLINKFNLNNIAAVQINNIFNGLINFIPFIAAIIADSFFGAFTVILISSIISLVGVIMFTLIVTFHSLRPPPCASISTRCEPPSNFQYSLLYIALVLGSLGLGGTRYILVTMGVDQFDESKYQVRFINWFASTLYFSGVICYTLLIYLEDNLSWILAYGIGLIANIIAILLFVFGSHNYRKISPQGSPFVDMARVVVAAIRKKKNSYQYESSESMSYVPPSNFRFLNRAALIEKSKNQEQDLKVKSWSLCTIEEVEDLKKLIKIMSIWSTSILYSTPIGVVISLTVLMAIVMDRSIGSYFKIPAGTFVVINLIFTAITTSISDYVIHPTYMKLTGKHLTHLQGIAVGHVCNILAVIGFALVEQMRLKLVQTHHLMDQTNSVAPMSALWLVFPLALLGIGEGFSFPAEMALFYQEFPNKLRGTSTSMMSLHIAIGFYLSSAFINLVGQLTSWLPDDINQGRVDKVCWLLLVIATLNFGYFLLCASLYKYNNPDPKLNGATIVSH